MGNWWAWQMTGQDKPLELVKKDIPEPGPGEVLVEVAGCGVCHTDLSFWHFGVKTRKEPPLTLGHEISGTVVAGDERWVGKPVVIPAVLPCGECDLCRSGRSNICRKQLMPGNDFDGGFSSHVVVPSRFISEVPARALERFQLVQLAVIADAISTPYQVIEKSGLREGDLAILIGVGGIGIFATLLAKIRGARIIAIDINDEKLKIARDSGAGVILNSKGKDIRTVKQEVRELAKSLGAPPHAWKIFEMSGTAAGQELAFALLTYASVFSVVGFTLDKLEVRLSNLMAFDAQLIGTWGCKPELYPEVLELVASGQLDIGPYVRLAPMSQINEVFLGTLEHKYLQRTVLVPDFE